MPSTYELSCQLTGIVAALVAHAKSAGLRVVVPICAMHWDKMRAGSIASVTYSFAEMQAMGYGASVMGQRVVEVEPEDCWCCQHDPEAQDFGAWCQSARPEEVA